MEKKLTSKKLFLFMGIKLLFIIIIIISYSSCKREENAWNEVRIINSTSGTLVLNLSKKYISDEGDKDTLYPNSEFLMARALYTSGFGIIEDDFGDSRDTIEIYRNDSLLIKWGGPLQDLPDSIHSFYNRNSWIIEEGGRKDKFVLATFTIINDDFEYD